MWPDAKQADMHSTWEQPFPLNSYQLAFTHFYKWKNSICVYILKAKNSTPNLISHRHPQVKLIARVSPAHHALVWTLYFLRSQGPRSGLYQWMAITLHPTPSFILPHTCQTRQHNLKLCKIMQHYLEGTKHAQKVSTPSSWKNIKVV